MSMSRPDGVPCDRPPAGLPLPGPARFPSSANGLGKEMRSNKENSHLGYHSNLSCTQEPAHMKQMSRSSRNDSKLSKIKQALSKYDAKYAKTSALATEYSSDDASDDGISKAEQSEARDIVTARHPSQDDDFKEHQGKPEDPVPVASVSLMVGSSVFNIEDDEAIKSESQRFSSRDQQHTVLKTDSSMDSIKTDTSAGFNNIHSVSSLANTMRQTNYEPALPSSNEVKPHILTKTPTSFTALHSVEGGMNYADTTVDNLVAAQCTDESVSLSHFLPHDARTSCDLDTDAKLEYIKKFGTSKTSRDLTSTSSKTSGNNSKSAHLLRQQAPKACPENSGCFTIDYQRRKSVAVQTYQRFSYSGTSKQQAQTRAETQQKSSIPVFKPVKLPCFSQNKQALSTLNENACYLQKSKEEMPSRLDMEISELVSEHLHLIKEFLERQHRMYLANCKAVQLLEYGYKQDDLCINCKGSLYHSVLRSSKNSA